MALSSPLRQPNSEALRLAQQTTQYLQKTSSAGTSTIPIPFIAHAESTELWVTYERQLLSCLRTGDDKAAHLCLERLIDRFGATNERVMGLHGLYQEAVAQNDATLNRILGEYSEVLADDPVNAPVAKRRIALLRTLSRPSDAIDALTELLESSPTDIEAWTELSDLYLSQGLYSQAAFCLEEVLLVSPNAWNIHARLGEVLYVSGTSAEVVDCKQLAEALRRFCRSIELCDDYLRGFYGLKMVNLESLGMRKALNKEEANTYGQASDKLLLISSDENFNRQINSSNNSELPPPSNESVRRLNEMATSKLAEIIRGSKDNGYDDAEVIAAKSLLDKSTQPMQR